VPILLAANICLGIYTSLSIWYKLSEKTIFGALISVSGVIITLTINFIFIPKYGYLASAYATLICYGSMMIISYFLGQYYYPVPYKIGKFFIYIISGGVVYYFSLEFIGKENFNLLEYGYQTLLIFCYVVLVYIIERPRKKISTN
jgi:O-antigen/teichoic acid export membrane protein